jgi:hypothetical protein
MDDQNLPQSYGKTRLVLLAVDPYLIHAYWEVTPEKLSEAKGQAVEAQAVLRFYKVNKAAGHNAEADWFDVEIDLQSRNWYVHLWSAEESYYADLALKINEGTLVRLVRSQVVHMPRTRPAIGLEQHFMNVEPARRSAELVPPPAGVYPQEAKIHLLSEVHVSQLPAKPIDSADIVREKLAKVYASREWRRERFEPKDVDAAMFELPQGTAAIDLTAITERKLATGISSGTLQTGHSEGGSDKKK